MRLEFHATNNEAEYKALIVGLKLAWSLQKLDQINGEYATKDMKMSTYLSKVKKLRSEFKEFSIEQLLRSKNSYADALANLGSLINSEYRRTILIEILAHFSIMNVEDICSIVKTNATWIDPIWPYIQNGNLSQRAKSARSCFEIYIVEWATVHAFVF